MNDALQFQIDQYFGPADGFGGSIQHALTKRRYRCIQFARGHAVIDETDFLRLRCSEQLTGQQVLFGTTEADALWPDSCATVTRNQHQGNMGVANLGRVCRENDIAHQGQGGAESNRSEEHTSELQSQSNLVCRLLLEKK